MCESYTKCQCLGKVPKPPKMLTLLLLDCWQREYDKRPYRCFRFRLIDFEERMERKFHKLRDFPVLVEFLRNRSQCSVYMSGIRVVPFYAADFVEGLVRLRTIELKLMELPAHFFEYLRCNVARMFVTHLSFEGTPLRTQDIALLRSYLIESKIIKHLNVSNCGIDQFNFAILADGMHKSKPLRGFKCSRLVGNKLSLDTEKIAHTVSSLIWQRKIEEIEMAQCEFTAHDMATIAEYLADTATKVQKLNFACNIIASDGAEHLFRAISVSHVLSYLDISRNCLGSHGGDVVAKYLSGSLFLRHLDISHNAIGADAMRNILLMMKKAFPLKMLKVYGNTFDSRSADILWRLLDAGVVLQEGIDITITYDEILDNHRIIPWYPSPVIKSYRCVRKYLMCLIPVPENMEANSLFNHKSRRTSTAEFNRTGLPEKKVAFSLCYSERSRSSVYRFSHLLFKSITHSLQ